MPNSIQYLSFLTREVATKADSDLPVDSCLDPLYTTYDKILIHPVEVVLVRPTSVLVTAGKTRLQW